MKSKLSIAGMILAMVTFIMAVGMFAGFLFEKPLMNGQASSLSSLGMFCFMVGIGTAIAGIILSANGNKKAKCGFSGLALALGIISASLMFLTPVVVFVLSMFG